MLFFYIQQTERLLQFDEHQVEYNPADLAVFINQARGQVALASEVLRQPAQLALAPGQQSYLFASATFTAQPIVVPGLLQVCNVRSARLVLATGGQRRLEVRSWEWFDTYYLSRSIPLADNPEVGPGGQPVIFARLQPGLTGTLWVSPIPDQAYTLNLDAVAWPALLQYQNGDNDPEALPQPWQDCVPFLAAHFAYLAKGDDAGSQRMLAEFQMFEQRAVQMTTPSRLPRIYPGGAGARLVNAQIPLTQPMRR